MSHSEQPATRMTLPMSMSQGTKEGIGTNQWTTACFVLNKLNALCDGNPPNVQKIWPDWTENLCSSHWGKCKFCDLDTWLQQSGPCLVAYPIVSVATKELSESVLLAASIAPKGILLLSQWHCIRISYYSLSLATRHPVQCRPNMRVAERATVWVCKCLQLTYLSALHLTLFDIYTVYTEIASAPKQISQFGATRDIHNFAYACVLMWQGTKEGLGTNPCERSALSVNLRES